MNLKGFFVAEFRCIIAAMIYGYARVSTDGQSVDAQVKQLREAGAERVFPRDGERGQIRPGAVSPGTGPVSTRAMC